MNLKTTIKRFLIFLVITLLLSLLTLGYLILFHSYHRANSDIQKDSPNNKIEYTDYDLDGDGLNNKDDIVKNAKQLKGIFYDYFKGRYNNIGGRLGFLVCIDVPRIAYSEAGIHFNRILEKDFQVNSEFYDTEDGINTPASPFFYRRVRNYYSFFEANNKLIRDCEQPQAGDLVFYGKYHVALVTGVHHDGTYDEIETAPWTGFVVEHQNKKWVPIDVGRILE